MRGSRRYLWSCWVYPQSFCSCLSMVCVALLNVQGYYCPVGSQSPYQNPCRPGTYCPVSSFNETLCPAGTWNPFFRNISSAACQVCPPGSYCPHEAVGDLFNYTCLGGYFCPAGSINSTGGFGIGPTLVCPTGYYCPPGTQYATQYPCPAGRYNTRTTMSFFDNCTISPVGSWSPVNSTNYILCIPSTYNAFANQTTVASCLACPAGYYCPNYGVTSFSAFPCTAGYFCPLYSTKSTGGSGASLLCPAGFYW